MPANLHQPRPADEAMLRLCARLFRSPGDLVYVAHHRVTQPIAYPPHRHEAFLQFDLAVRCEGRWRVGGRTVAAHGVTAVLLAPGCEHGYELRPAAADSEFFTLKVHDRPEANEAGQVQRTVAATWPAVVQDVQGAGPLVQAFRRLHHLWIAPACRPAALVAAATQVLALWPGGEQQDRGATPASARAAMGVDSRIEAALHLIDQRLSNPPDLDELSQAAKLSARQLSRRFMAVFGCTPRRYVALRRIAAARDLLAGGGLNVSETADALGFNSLQAFSRWFRRETGQASSAFREG